MLHTPTLNKGTSNRTIIIMKFNMNTTWKINYCQVPKLLITLTTKVILVGGDGLIQPIHIFNNPILLYFSLKD